MNTKQIYKVNLQIEDNLIIFQIAGYFNLACGELLLKLFKENAAVGYDYYLIDMSDVTNINSSGLSILIEMIEILGKINGELYLMNINAKITRIIELMGIFEFIGTIDSINDLKR